MYVYENCNVTRCCHVAVIELLGNHTTSNLISKTESLVINKDTTSCCSCSFARFGYTVYLFNRNCDVNRQR